MVAGDWSLTPEVLTAARWPELVSGVVVATVAPTCHQSMYDYSVVSNSLAQAVAGLQRVEDAGLSLHYPLGFCFVGMRGDWR